jgi:uncharacterized protein YbjT (DUF2867 family)
LTRDAKSEKSRQLADRGAEVFEADMADAAAMDSALDGAYGVFSVQNFRTAKAEGEVKQGVTLAEAAKRAGVQHFVYSSVGGAERVRGIPHFDTKWEIEGRIRDLGLPATILRPAAFMDMFGMPKMRAATLGVWVGALPKEKSLQMIAVSDIGAFAALALERPEEFVGKALEIAGDDLTVPQMISVIEKTEGRRPRYFRMPKFLLKMMGAEARMFSWCAESGYTADITALRGLHPGLLTLEQYLAARARAPQRA